jgi:hypothetical protein
MRLLSLLITLLVIGWLIYSQMGESSKPVDRDASRQAEARAAAVNAQVQDQFAHQADQLSKMEAGGGPAGNP